MARALRTPQANVDLVDIWLYVARDSPEAADRLMETIGRKCESLAKFPEMGQRCEQLTQAMRYFTAGNYVIFYRPIDDGIEVVRVVSGARDIRSLFDPEN